MFGFFNDLMENLSISILVSLVVCLSCFFALSSLDNKVETAEEMISNGSLVYLDGQLINSDYIDLDNYTISFKDDLVILSN